MNFVQRIFPYGFRKSANAHSTPRVRFEAIAIGSYLALKDKPDLAFGAGPDVSGWIDGDDFKEVTTSDAANVKSKLQSRLDFVRRALVEV